MPDMLVRLYDLPDVAPLLGKLAEEGIIVRRAEVGDMPAIRRHITEQYGEDWTAQVAPACSNQPISLFIAQEGTDMIGFAVYDTVRRNIFGPIGVHEDYRGHSIGRALLLSCLHTMHQIGYEYAIIGSAGPQEFYKKCCGAIVIPDSDPSGPWQYPRLK